MSTYKAELPSTVIDPRIPEFFEKFYGISDNPTSHEEYARSFTEDATVIMGLKKVTGYAEILEFRKGLWSGPVVKRLHTLSKIFPFGDDSNEAMVYGDVKYGLKNGKEVVVQWAGRAVFGDAQSDKPLQMHFYHVYLDASPVAAAMKD